MNGPVRASWTEWFSITITHTCGGGADTGWEWPEAQEAKTKAAAKIDGPRRCPELVAANTLILRAVNRIGPERQLVVQCECGWETRGTEDQIVPAIQKHASESHNMKVTREQVLAKALPV